MKRVAIESVAVALLVIIAVSVLCVINNSLFVSAAESPEDNTFYVGVTYCGNSVGDAKLLIDKVKNYTNVFILQSGRLQTDNSSIDAIGDYAVNSGLNFIAYMGVSSFALANNWLSGYDGRWGTHFLGIYLDDEPGGKMLDAQTYLTLPNTQQMIIKMEDSTIYGYWFNQASINYMRSGTVNITLSNINSPYYVATYYKNGTITGQKTWDSPEIIIDDTSILPYTYDELWNACPIQNSSQAAEIYVNQHNRTINTVRSESDSALKMFTSDYALQWFDYQSGYDVVLTELGWNQTELGWDQSTTQEIALARGAANLYGKDWGAMITWKYMQKPYLASGDEIYQQMCQVYENGAKYIAIFNYANDMQGPYGIMQDEHFQALQRFWTDEVNNPNVIHRQVKTDTAFVLPTDFGSGLRKQDDIVWGFWAPTPQEQQVWLQLQNALKTHGQKLDIVYNDTAHPATGKYAQIIYLSSNSSPNLNSNWLMIALLVVVVVLVLAVLLVVLRRRKN